MDTGLQDLLRGRSLPRYLLIAFGGALGAMANLSACFLIGLVIEYLNRHTGLSLAWRFLIPTGFIGAYSTFSTFEFEAWADYTRGNYWIGLLYVIASLVGGFLLVAAGVATARTLR